MRTTARAASIARAAAHLWATRGYHGTGMEELSQVVGLQRGALYHHIGSKESLLHEIGRTAIERLLAATEDDPTLEPSERLRRLSRGLMKDIAAHQAEWTVFFREMEWLTGERRDEIFAMRRRYETIWATVLEDGAATGAFRRVHPLVVKGVLGMHNYSYLWLRPQGDLPPEAVADLFVDVLLNGLRGPMA